jgi:hypothetical protein
VTAGLAERVQEDRADRAAAAGGREQEVRGRAVLTVLGAVFSALGWVTGAAVSITAFCWGAVRYGYARGRIVAAPAPQPAGSR